MIKFLSAMCLVLMLSTIFLFNSWDKSKRENAFLISQQKLLIAENNLKEKQIKDFNNAQNRAAQTIKKLQSIAGADDCYNKPMPADVMRLFRGE